MGVVLAAGVTVATLPFTPINAYFVVAACVIGLAAALITRGAELGPLARIGIAAASWGFLGDTARHAAYSRHAAEAWSVLLQTNGILLLTYSAAFAALEYRSRHQTPLAR